jgi:Arc/MetJ-type ribon-helix-helix transcriptional regulator
MNIETRSLSEVVREAIRVLVAEMGAANTARVINYFSIGYGNYTEERVRTFAGYTVDDIVREIRQHEKQEES